MVGDAASSAQNVSAAFNTPSQTSMYHNTAYDSSSPNKWSKNGFGVPILKQTGKFTKEETEKIKSAIEEYCAAKKIPVTRLCAECDHKSELKGAWMEISKRLPHRSVQSVYRHGLRQCHPFKRGSWSAQEVVILQDLVAKMGKKWSTIQTKLNRSADSCRDKYREMSEEYVKGRWQRGETTELKKHIFDYLSSNAVKNAEVKAAVIAGRSDPKYDMKELGKLVEAVPSIQIPWSNISKKMGKRSRLSCFKKWQKITSDVPGNENESDDDEDDSNNKKKKSSKKQTRGSKRKKSDSTPAATTDQERIIDATLLATAAGGTSGEYYNVQNEVNNDDEENEVLNSAKMAAETVEAVDLPDTVALVIKSKKLKKIIKENEDDADVEKIQEYSAI